MKNSVETYFTHFLSLAVKYHLLAVAEIKSEFWLQNCIENNIKILTLKNNMKKGKELAYSLQI